MIRCVLNAIDSVHSGALRLAKFTLTMCILANYSDFIAGVTVVSYQERESDRGLQSSRSDFDPSGTNRSTYSPHT